MCGAWWQWTSGLSREMSSGGLVWNHLWSPIYGICLISSTYSVDIQFDASVFHHEFWINISQKTVIAGTMVIFHPGCNFRCRSAASPPGCHLAPLQCWLSAGDLRHGWETPIFHGKIIEVFHGQRKIFEHAMFGKRVNDVNDVNVQLSIFYDLLKSHSNFNLAIQIRSWNGRPLKPRLWNSGTAGSFDFAGAEFTSNHSWCSSHMDQVLTQPRY